LRLTQKFLVNVFFQILYQNGQPAQRQVVAGQIEVLFYIQRLNHRTPQLHCALQSIRLVLIISPHLAWSGAPPEVRSFAITCFDPDGPTGSGFWHWVVYDIPADIQELASGAGTADGTALPNGAKQLKNDASLYGYLGSAPPAGHGPHRYIFAVHALSIDALPIDPQASAAVCGFNMFANTLARALITPVYEQE
jgi:Raf kinase inhibitor-like YbhB/YbcL family protein